MSSKTLGSPLGHMVMHPTCWTRAGHSMTLKGLGLQSQEFRKKNHVQSINFADC
jgi:hypothetical protein